MKDYKLILVAGFWLVVASVMITAQVIRPDGITKTTNQHKVDLSACDEVVIEVPVQDVRIAYGTATIYAWRKYGVSVKITCSMVGK